MKNINFIILFLIFLVFLSCRKMKKENNQASYKDGNKIDIENLIKRYINDIPYLLNEEIDSIEVNNKKFVNDKQYRLSFIEKAKERKEGIKLLNSYTSGKNIPTALKKYLLPKELVNFNKDSLLNYVILYDLYTKRRRKINNIIKYDFLKDNELQKLIRDSYKDSIYFKQLVLNRRKQDSISYWSAYNNRKDKLQNIIHPVDSFLPFGPKPLGRMIEGNIDRINFTVLEEGSISIEDTKNRKDIYDIWMYFLEFHPYEEDEDLGDDYVELVLPKIKSYEAINLGINENLDELSFTDYSSFSSPSFQVRISNIGNYEVYYATTGVDSGKNNCGKRNHEIENCCFSKFGYFCNSRGYIILYDRKKQHAKIITSYNLQMTEEGPESGYADFRFFYMKDNVIHLFDGSSWSNFDTNNDSFIYDIEVGNTYEIQILDNGNLVVDEQCVLKKDVDKKKYYKEGYKSISEEFDGGKNHKMFIEKRNSIFSKKQPSAFNYPFGPSALKQINNVVGNNTKQLDSIFNFYKFLKREDPYPSYYTLPLTDKVNKINVGKIEVWNKGLIQNFQKITVCDNIDFDADDINDYKLPSLHNYEVYFSKYNNKGVLALYDPITNEANLINVLDYKSSGNSLRFFYINSINQIEIYEGYENSILNYDKKQNISVIKTYIIEVLSNGEIKIIPQNLE